MLCRNNLTPYFMTRQVVSEGGDVPIPFGCNGYVAVNIGTAIAFVNGFPINPPLAPGMNGESVSVGGNYGEMLADENLEITFGAATGQMVFLSFKRYTKLD